MQYAVLDVMWDMARWGDLQSWIPFPKAISQAPFTTICTARSKQRMQHGCDIHELETSFADTLEIRPKRNRHWHCSAFPSR